MDSLKHEHREWTPELAVRTEQIIRKAKEHKPNWIVRIDSLLYWIMLFLAIAGNFAVSVILVPMLIALKGITLYFTLFFTGASFGWFFTYLLHELEETGKHIKTSILIAALAIINIGIFAILSNKLITMLNIATPPHNPLLVGAIYVFGYVLPDAIRHVKKNGQQ